mmetsp:Transcript_8013/g.17231  ORF Transcript_8013/g.17231 Transcript_8013/m.17231 type:complete len:397 (+) Transcript_8013:47-1237(+)
MAFVVGGCCGVRAVGIAGDGCVSARRRSYEVRAVRGRRVVMRMGCDGDQKYVDKVRNMKHAWSSNAQCDMDPSSLSNCDGELGKGAAARRGEEEWMDMPVFTAMWNALNARRSSSHRELHGSPYLTMMKMRGHHPEKVHGRGASARLVRLGGEQSNEMVVDFDPSREQEYDWDRSWDTWQNVDVDPSSDSTTVHASKGDRRPHRYHQGKAPKMVPRLRMDHDDPWLLCDFDPSREEEFLWESTPQGSWTRPVDWDESHVPSSTTTHTKHHHVESVGSSHGHARALTAVMSLAVAENRVMIERCVDDNGSCVMICTMDMNNHNNSVTAAFATQRDALSAVAGTLPAEHEAFVVSDEVYTRLRQMAREQFSTTRRERVTSSSRVPLLLTTVGGGGEGI